MLPYWILYAIFALGSFGGVRRTTFSVSQAPLFFAAMVVMMLMIGLRFQTGGDWKNYDIIFAWIGSVPPATAMAYGDPGYSGLNILVHWLGQDIWLVNMVCATLFVWGLWQFARTEPSPWLTCAVAVPYLVIVVVMGYSRQGVAIGMVMAAIAAFQRRDIKRFAVYFLIAVLFHKSAIIILPIIALSTTRHRFIVLLLAGVFGGIGLAFLVDRLLGSFFNVYFGTEMSSDGAGIRVVMNLVPALIYLPLQRYFVISEQDRLLWRNFAWLALVLAAAVVVSPSTTAVDRISLYLFPFQMAVLSRLPIALSRTGKVRGDVLIGVLSYMAVIQFIWLNFATNAHWWVPYQII